MKDGLKIVSKTKMKNDWSTNQYQSTNRLRWLCISYTVNLESIKTVYKKTMYISFCKRHIETLNINGVDFFHFD